jgi:SAM-dependent methyltransferase
LPEAASEWGERAATLYQTDYARRYRAADDEIRQGALVARFSQWLAQVCDSFGREITALDLGCGTGRYFRALRHVRELVGIDVSAAMLAEAEHPVGQHEIQVGRIALVLGDFLTQPFEPASVDLVYSIGVLGEHTPVDRRVADRVHRVLRASGRFAFTAVHWRSFSVPRTLKRRIGEWLLPVTSGAVHQRLRDRVLAGGLYVDEQYLTDVLERAGFTVESLDRHMSDVHLHCLCVARKRD